MSCAESEEIKKPAHPNVFILVVDSLRADRLGREPAATPALDRLANEGARFETSTLATTDPVASVVTLLTSLPPEQHGVHGSDLALSSEALTIPEVLAERGFATAAFVREDLFSGQRGLGQGFESVERIDAASADDSAYVKPVARWLADWKRDDSARPFFAYVHTALPAAADSADAYDRAVARADARAGELIALVDDLQSLNDTVVVVTSTRSHAFRNADAPSSVELAVPLVFRMASRLAPGAVHADIARTMDLGPTLMMLAKVRRPDAFGFTHSAYGLAMRDLVEILVGVPRDLPVMVTGEGHHGDMMLQWLQLGDYRLVRHTDSGAAERFTFYDIANDPNETEDLIESEAQRGSMFVHKLRAWRSIVEARPDYATPIGASP
ncbi:MAG: sulfatase-like hydrolase/transferase [Myxococcota bacterium]|nr:sulfatase-like hydrolase/transferase [Myxococcota bacterium]